MKLYKIFFFILVFLIMVLSIGCNNTPKYTEEEWKQIKVSSSNQEINSVIETISTESAKKAEIDDYNRRLSDWNKYVSDSSRETAKNREIILDLENKRVEAIRNKDFLKALTYIEILVDEEEALINNLSKIYVPQIAKDAFSLDLESQTKWKQVYAYVLTDPNNTNSNESLRLVDEANNAIIKSNQEIKRIREGFNQEARELGLSIPFQ